MLSSKSPSPAWEEISQVGPEPEADTGFDKIHASRRGNAADQCCLPRWLALALASTKDRLSFPHCLEDHSSQILQGFSKSRLHWPAAIRHCGHEALLSCEDMERLQRSQTFAMFSCK